MRFPGAIRPNIAPDHGHFIARAELFGLANRVAVQIKQCTGVSLSCRGNNPQLKGSLGSHVAFGPNPCRALLRSYSFRTGLPAGNSVQIDRMEWGFENAEAPPIAVSLYGVMVTLPAALANTLLPVTELAGKTFQLSLLRRQPDPGSRECPDGLLPGVISCTRTCSHCHALPTHKQRQDSFRM